MEPKDLPVMLAREIPSIVTGGLVSAYLFGSEAEGRAHRESDVDVAVLLDRREHATPRSRFDQQVLLSSRLSTRLSGRPVDVVILNDAPPLLARRTMLDGLRLLCLDEAADREFRLRVQLRAADLQPFLARMRRLKLESLRTP